MIWSTKNTIFETNGWINYESIDSILYTAFGYDITKYALKVDNVDSIVDKFETSQLSLYIVIIKSSDKDGIKRKSFQG